MRALFVHGMGRSPLSGWRMLRHLQAAGLNTETFWYSTTFESFTVISERLRLRIKHLSELNEPYVLIGHSLGGMLIRSALTHRIQPSLMPERVFLLGSPVKAVTLAKALQNNAIYRLFTGDCGQLLANEQGMNTLAIPEIPCIAIIGTRGFSFTKAQFAGEANDGVISVSEAKADWLAHVELVPMVHSLLPASTKVASTIISLVRSK